MTVKAKRGRPMDFAACHDGFTACDFWTEIWCRTVELNNAAKFAFGSSIT